MPSRGVACGDGLRRPGDVVPTDRLGELMVGVPFPVVALEIWRNAMVRASWLSEETRAGIAAFMDALK
jgi:hypothetical protein